MHASNGGVSAVARQERPQLVDVERAAVVRIELREERAHGRDACRKRGRPRDVPLAAAVDDERDLRRGARAREAAKVDHPRERGADDFVTEAEAEAGTTVVAEARTKAEVEAGAGMEAEANAEGGGAETDTASTHEATPNPGTRRGRLHAQADAERLAKVSKHAGQTSGRI